MSEERIIKGKLIKVEVKEGVSGKGNAYKVFNGVVLTDDNKNKMFNAGFKDINEFTNKMVIVKVSSEKKVSATTKRPYTANTLIEITEDDGTETKVPEEFVDDDEVIDTVPQTNTVQKPVAEKTLNSFSGVKTEQITKGDYTIPLSSTEYWNRKEARDIDYARKDNTKQIHIIRQNSYTQANSFLGLIYDKVKDKDPKDLLKMLETIAHKIEEDILRMVDNELIKLDPKQAVYLAIKDKDEGVGVMYQEITDEGISDIEADKYVNELLRSGEIFEIKPGVYKILI